MNKQNRVRQFLTQVAGISDPDKVADSTGDAITRLFGDIKEPYQAGLISFAFAQDAERGAMRLFLQEAADTPEVYRALRANGQFDAIRNMAGGYESDGSDEQRERQQDDALSVVMGYAADAGLMQRRISPQQYAAMIDMADPGSLADGRVRAGYNQPDPHDLDGKLRDLDADETGNVGAATYARRVGLAGDLPEPKAEPDTPQESASDAASDWSTDRLEKYFALRDAEREASHSQDERNRDPALRRLTSGSPLDAALNPGEYKG
jgi:hypothetical protein